MMKEQVEKLIQEQLIEWPLVSQNFAALGKVQSKDITVGHVEYRAQFNPARIVSSAAKVDTKSIQERKCFLCAQNRPKEQKGVRYKQYEILINPFPIFPRHLTIPDVSHVDQVISNRIADMLDLARELDDYVIFYNGPKCGASAPDHMHFQAGNKAFMGIETDVKLHSGQLIFKYKDASLYLLDDAPRNSLVFTSKNIPDLTSSFELLYKLLPIHQGEIEPMMNLLAWYDGMECVLVVLLRSKHRPSCYFADGEEKMTISPASVDLGGVFITPIESDFERIDSGIIQEILSEVCMPKSQIIELLSPLKQ